MRKYTMGLTILVVCVALAGGAALAACAKKAEEPAEAGLYTCPMHPEVMSDKPGECPTCGMDLVPTGEVGGTGNPGETEETSGAAETAAGYNCPMHPEMMSGGPGECPTCGMDLVPTEEKAEEEPSGEEHGHGGM